MATGEPCICLSCMQPIDDDSAVITCAECANTYHMGKYAGTTKTSLKALSTQERKSWTCPTCSIHARQKAKSSSVEPTLSQILSAIRMNGTKTTQVLERLSLLETKLETLSVSHCELTARVDSNTSTLDATEIHVAKLERELGEANKEMSELRSTVNELEQYERRFNLELRGLAVKQSEDIYEVINHVASYLDIPCLSSSDVEAVHRLPAKDGCHPPILIKFKDRQVRDKWFSKRSNLRSMPPAAEGGQPIFMCENLTFSNKSLLWETRQLAKQKGFAYVWIRNGHIYVRQTDTAKAIRVRSKLDLADL